MAEPELTTERLVLWLPAPDAAARMLRFHHDNHEHVSRWMPPPPPDWSAVAFWERKLAANRDDAAHGRSVAFAMALRDDPERHIVGTVTLSDIARGALQQAQLGFAIDHRHEGRGLMIEAVQAVCAYAFDTLRLHRIAASYMPDNDRSAHVLRRCGFVEVGIARDYLFVDDAWRDHVLMALLDPQARPPATPGRESSSAGSV